VEENKRMKGIILAGGKGTRLYPLTIITNKHLIPIGFLPMLEYPLYTLNLLKPKSICLVTGGEHFQHLAGYCSKLHEEIPFSYHYQSKAGGIAQALSLTEQFAKDSKIAVILGDNIFEEDFSKAAKKFEESDLGAMFFLKQVFDPQRFGVAEINGDRILSIEEKPKIPKSNLAVTGLYFYDSTVFEKIKKIKPSLRGELEITDVNNMYIKEGRAGFHLLKGFWSDAGTFPSRIKCEEFVNKSLILDVLESLSENSKEILLKESSLPKEILSSLKKGNFK
jgi:glucose-1-phosphate thymidylyltransferase